jgi:sigma-B regulation protein RsbU (phosphoserine phosphatase)
MTASNSEAVDAFIDALLDDDAERLYERAPCGYLSTTPDGTIVKVNQTFLTLTGYERSDLLGRKRFDELLTTGGRIYHETHYAPMLQVHGSAREIALDLVRGDGSRLPVLVNSVLERDPAGAPLVIRIAVFDATHRREYEHELLRAKRRAEASEAHATALAQTLQQTLIPPTPPAIPHLDVAARYRPAGDGAEVGGDFYDVFQVGSNDWVVALGDVCGKGVEAAVVTALARYTLRAATMVHREPHRALLTLNDVLLRHDTERFCTVVLIRLTRTDGAWRAVVSCGGHPPPILRAADGSTGVVGTSGTLLGVRTQPRLADTAVELVPGDLLMLYTDGVSEGRRGDQFYDDGDRIRQLVSAADRAADAAAGALLDDVMAFQDGTAHDDIAIVAVRVPPS